MTAQNHLQSEFDVAVAGAGPAGLACALLTARAGLATALIARVPASGSQDPRTSALMQGSIRLLKHLEIWQALEPHAAPLWTMRLIDDTGRAPKIEPMDFSAREIGDEPFGWNIPNQPMLEALLAMARAMPDLTLIEGPGLEHLEARADRVLLYPADAAEPVAARLVIGADGRNSVVRTDAGIGTERWSYDQTAIVASFTHTLAHENISTEFHRKAGPLTVVPLGDKRSSLVWIEHPVQARRLMTLGDQAFRAELTQALKGALGNVKAITTRQAFPISGLTVRRYAQARAMLVGEAAHVLPPIGAQGLNLGLRDAALAAEIAGDAQGRGEDPGGRAALDLYDRRRRRDVLPRAIMIDLMNRSLMSDLAPVQGLRALAMRALKTVPPLRRKMMAEGIAPGQGLPRVMQPSPSP